MADLLLGLLLPHNGPLPFGSRHEPVGRRHARSRSPTRNEQLGAPGLRRTRQDHEAGAVQDADLQGSKRDADRAMRALLAEVDRGVISEGTFGELVERWFEVASTTRDWSPKGIAETRRIIDTRLGALGPIVLDKLRTPVIDGYYAELRTHGGACGHRPRQSHDGDLCEVGPPLSTATVRRIHAVIHSALEQAVAWDMLMFNPAVQGLARPDRLSRDHVARGR